MQFIFHLRLGHEWDLMKRAFKWSASLGCLLLGCSSGDECAMDWSAGRGSTGCHDWEREYCELQSMCWGADVNTCGRQLQAVQCSSEDVAASCAEFLSKASCGPIANGCHIEEIADMNWAVATCNAHAEFLCERMKRCDGTVDVASCESDTIANQGCARAIGVKLRYEGCVERISSLSCGNEIPSECAWLFYIGA